MADFNQNNNTKREYEFKPTYTVSSFSSCGSNDKYLAIDIWNASVFFTFGDKSNPDKPIINKISVPADKLMIIERLLEKIQNRRLHSLYNKEPYQCVEPISIEAFTNEPNLQNAKVYISIQTTTVDGTERLSITGNINERSINIILANQSLSKSTENADFESTIDVEDAPVARLLTTIQGLPLQVASYKRDLAFHRMLKYDRNNKANPSNNVERATTSFNARPNTNMSTVEIDDGEGGGDVPF